MLTLLLAFSLIAKTAKPLAKPARPQPAVVYSIRKAAGVKMHIVQADVRRSDVNLAIVTAKDGIGSREPWSTLVNRARPVAAITGTYFDTVTGIPVGSIGVGGRSVFRGSVGTALAYKLDGRLTMQPVPPLAAFDPTGQEMWLRAGPRLLTRGRTTLYAKQEGFRDPSIFMRKKRSAVAITRSGKLLLVAVEHPITLRQLAAGLKGIGAYDAMCLDGGSSAGMYYGGKTCVAPTRKLTNLLVVYDTVDRYQLMLPTLNA
jgi:hypothetical protein